MGEKYIKGISTSEDPHSYAQEPNLSANEIGIALWASLPSLLWKKILIEVWLQYFVEAVEAFHLHSNWGKEPK